MTHTDRDEKEAGGPATQASPKPRPKHPNKPPERLPPWKVILHNDDVSEMQYVVETIVMLTPLRTLEAESKIHEAETRGAAILLTTHRELAELYRDQFTSRKLTVTIEQAA